MLIKGALTCYTLFPEHSIDSFPMIVDVLVKAHVGAQKVETHMEYISKIK